MSLSLFGIILGLVLLMFLAYKGYSIIWVAPVCAVVVAVLSGYAILDAYIGDYMKGMADYVLQWFPAFFLGAVYGKVMDLTGSARSLGNALVKLIGPRCGGSSGYPLPADDLWRHLPVRRGVRHLSHGLFHLPGRRPAPAPCCPAPLPLAPSASP